MNNPLWFAAKTQIHELGHSFGAGEADDRSAFDDPLRKVFQNGEVYSGSGDDETPEPIRIGSADTALWSIMSSGWENDLAISPAEGRYFMFSIEEVSTVA